MKDVLEIEVPTSLDSITLKQYQKWCEIVEAMGDDPDEGFLNKSLVRIFCGIPKKEVDKIDYLEFEKVFRGSQRYFLSKDRGTYRKVHDGRCRVWF